MYRVVLASACVTPDVAPEAARDIAEEFKHSRGTLMSNVSGMARVSFFKQTTILTQMDLLCWMNSLTQSPPG